jgi:hypothetical protein
MATTSNSSSPETAASVLGSTAVYEDKMVEVTLAVFLSPRNAKNLGLKEQEYKPNEKLRVHRDDAAALISQGAVQVNKDDNAEVAKVLGIKL